MNIKSFLDATYLKTAKQAAITIEQDLKIVATCIQEAIDENFKLIMIRPKHVALASKMIASTNSKLLVGTVIDFPKGKSDLDFKLTQAQKAIDNGADDLDFVANYRAFKKKKIELVKNEILEGTKLGLQNNRSEERRVGKECSS